jgi:hypothetical protein
MVFERNPLWKRLKSELLFGGKGRTLLWLKRFWIALLIPISLSTTLLVLILNQNNLWWSFGFSQPDLEFASTLLRWPLGILAITLPLVALVAALHRSEQTAELLTLSQAQNNFANYFLHRDKFFELVHRLEKEWDVEFKDKGTLYRRVFPRNNSNFITTVSESDSPQDSDPIIIEYNTRLLTTIKMINDHNESSNLEKHVDNLLYQVLHICALLAIEFKQSDHTYHSNFSDNPFTSFPFFWGDTDTPMQIVSMLSILRSIAEFSHLPVPQTFYPQDKEVFEQQTRKFLENHMTTALKSQAG